MSKITYEVYEDKTPEGKTYGVREVKGSMGWQVFKAKHREVAEAVAEILKALKELDEKLDGEKE